jgi:hypothetical protein
MVEQNWAFDRYETVASVSNQCSFDVAKGPSA